MNVLEIGKSKGSTMYDKNWQIDENRAFLLEIIDKIDAEPSLIGASPHIMCVGTKMKVTDDGPRTDRAVSESFSDTAYDAFRLPV